MFVAENVTKVRLALCGPCKALVDNVAEAPHRDCYTQLPELCPECGAKVAQCVRILNSGGFLLWERK
jgi:hypothetical protein